MVQAPHHVISRDGARSEYTRQYSEITPKVMLMDAWQGRYELHDLVSKVSETCRKLKVDTLLIENKAAGHSVAQEIRRMYGHEKFGVHMFDPKSQDKLARLYSVQHLFAEGIVYAPLKQWSEMVITQVAQFPKAKHDDLVDTVSMAMRHLRETGAIMRSEEFQSDMTDNLTFKSGSQWQALYPI